MDWISGLAIFTIVAGVTISVVVLLAVRRLRETLAEGAVRQGLQIKRLVETATMLYQQQQIAQERILGLTEANRKFAEELAALGERVADDDGPSRPGGAPRLLH
ncbi:conserved hypothetical protein [uncultured Gammaproteobacteria bacterium]